MDSIENITDGDVQTTLAFRLDPSLGGIDHIQIGQHHNLMKDWQDVKIYDISGREQNFTLDEAGFEFVCHNTATKDFLNDRHVTSEYYEEVAQLAKEVTSATFAHCYQHVLRASKNGDTTNRDSKVIGPAYGLHVDYNYTSAPEYIHTLPERPPEWEQLSQNRWAIISVWRPTTKVTRDALCVGDKRTVSDSDLVEGSTDMSALDRKQKLGLFWVNYNPAQEYYYKKGMDPDNVLLIKLYDSKLDGRARCTPHSAFAASSDYGNARNSIETRCVVVWEGESLS